MNQFIQYSGWPHKVDEHHFLKVKHLPSLIIYLKRVTFSILVKSEPLVCVLFMKAPYRFSLSRSLYLPSQFLSSPLLRAPSPSLHLSLSLLSFASLFSPSALDGTCIWEGILGIPDMPVVWMDIVIQVPTFRPAYSGRLWQADGCCVVWVVLSCVCVWVSAAGRVLYHVRCWELSWLGLISGHSCVLTVSNRPDHYRSRTRWSQITGSDVRVDSYSSLKHKSWLNHLPYISIVRMHLRFCAQSSI